MPFGIQPIHIVLIIVVALLIFGPKQLPDMGRSIGKALSEFRSGAKEMTEGFRQEVSHPVTPQAASPTIQPSTFRLQTLRHHPTLPIPLRPDDSASNVVLPNFPRPAFAAVVAQNSLN